MSPSHFQATFRRITGLSFGRYCLQARLSGAADLLANSDLPVTEVARRTGYCDDSHLHRHFRRHFGATPRAYRARRRP